MINFIPTQSDTSPYCRSLSYQAQRQEVVQRVHLIVTQLLDLNGFSTDDEGYNLTAQDILDAYDEYDGDVEAIVQSIKDDICLNNGIEDEDWKDVSSFCVVCSS